MADSEIATSVQDTPPGANRRNFISKVLSVSSGLAFSNVFAKLWAQTTGRACLVNCPDNPAQPGALCQLELQNPPEIASGPDNMLHGVLVVHKEMRDVPFMDNTTKPPRISCQTLPLRSFEGYKGKKLDPSQRVTTPGKAGPGPTFRAAVGQTAQIAVLNHIGPTDFPATVDITHPEVKGCDVVVNANTKALVYPTGSDAAPNCFHASNTINIHFHGTHVTPDCWGDNVLVSVYPDPKSTPEECDPIFAICADSTCPNDWKHHDAKRYQTFQTWKKKAFSQLAKLDASAEKADTELESYGEWPQYWPGYYPNCLSFPKWEPNGKFAMGQAPGTHWYHTHQHGATSIHILNGLAGAFIITGDYDAVLHRTMPNVQEKVLVLQQFQTQPNRERGAGGAPALNVNGQLQPVINMKPGEVQWWRILNATVQATAINHFAFLSPAAYASALKSAQAENRLFTIPNSPGTAIPQFRQIAQDGVQFHWLNYKKQIGNEPVQTSLAPANRIDILVKAPTQPGISILAFGAAPNNQNGLVAVDKANILAYINVVPDTSGNYNKVWPETEGQYPVQPDFLKDITEWKGDNTVTFSMDGVGQTPKIDNKVFSDHRIDQSVLLGSVQQWTIVNTSPFAHPFHIHVNPFQVVAILDPSQGTTAVPLPQPWIWWDTFMLPPAKNGVASQTIMRSKFVDFPGKFVLHCHILAHEDRGMMQLVEVRDNWTPISHAPHTM